MSYDQAFANVMTVEGGYSNLSTDPGGETYRGIARNRNPQWEGWKIVDEYKRHSSFPKIMDEDKKLQDYIKQWYKENYWDIFNLDNITDILAEEIFEQAVNIGQGRATLHIQKVCNAFNLKDRFGPDIAEDSKVGPATRKRLRDVDIFTARYQSPVFAKAMDALQGAYYVDLANGSNKNIHRNNFAGWINQRLG